MATIQNSLDSVLKAAKVYGSNLIEIILVDNNSVDRGPKIIKTWQKSNPEIKMKLFKESTPNCPGLARNIGISNSTAPYILFLDSDDCFHVDIFSALNMNINSDTELIIFNYEVKQMIQNSRHKKNRNLISYSSNKIDFLKQYVIMDTDNSIIAMCFSKKLLLQDENILFGEGIYEDIYFLAQAILKANKVDFLNRTLYIKNENFGSISNSLTKHHIYCYIKAWNSVQSLIANNLFSSISSQNIDKSIRGIIGQMAMKIESSNLNYSEKEEMRLYLAKTILKFYPIIEKHLSSSENTLLDLYAMNIFKGYTRSHD